MIYLVIQGELKDGAEAIYEQYLQAVAPLMKEFQVEIVAVGAGLKSEYTNEIFPVNAVLRLPDEATLERFLGDARYLEIKVKFRDAAYEHLRLSAFGGRDPRVFD